MRKFAWVLAGVMWLSACSSKDQLEQASESYKQHRDYASLRVVADHLQKGMPRGDVENLLGAPDYSPVEGTSLYSSDRKEFSKDAQREMVVGLIVEFRDANGNVTDNIESWSLEPIGE